MSDPEIVIYNHPNPEMKSFLTNEEISAPRLEHFKKPFNENSVDVLKNQLGFIGAQIVKEIMSIQGVKEMRIKPKEVYIRKELSCAWEEIETPVIDILKRGLRRKQYKLVKG